MTTPVLAQVAGAVRGLAGSTSAVVAALVVGAVIIVLAGDDPREAYRALFDGALGDRRSVAETLVLATPLIFGGLAFAIAARAGLFNIGIEGQFFLGSLAAGLVGAIDLGLPLVAHLPVALLAGTAAGAIWGWLPGVVKARTGAHEVITTIMLNYIAFQISSFVLRQDATLAVNPDFSTTDPVEVTAELPLLLDRTRLHAGILLAIAAAMILWYLLFRTTFGYRIRTVGLSRGASAYAGISWGRTIALAMLVSGVLGGLGGAVNTLGLAGRHYSQPAGYGFTAIAVGLVGRNHPFGIVLAGLLFGALNAGSTRMQAQAGTSRELVLILQGLVILSVAAFAAVSRIRRDTRPTTGTRPGTDRSAAVGTEPAIEPRPGTPAL